MSDSEFIYFLIIGGCFSLGWIISAKLDGRDIL